MKKKLAFCNKMSYNLHGSIFDSGADAFAIEKRSDDLFVKWDAKPKNQKEEFWYEN